MNRLLRVVLLIITVLGVGRQVIGVNSMTHNALTLSSGNVTYKNGMLGIGITFPMATVHVSGNIKFSTDNSTIASSNASNTITSRLVKVVGGKVDWTKGHFQEVTVGAGAVTMTFVDPPGPCGLLLKVKRTGSSTLAFPATVLWPYANPLDQTSSEQGGGSIANPVVDFVGFYFDGVNYYADMNILFGN